MDQDEKSRRDRLNSVIAKFLKSVDDGKAADHQELLDQHPDLADELSEFFAANEQMKRVYAGPRPPKANTTPQIPPQQAAYSEPHSSNEIPTRNLKGAPPPAAFKRHESPNSRFFGNYELLREIARGGMGVVYEARQTNLDRTVALKMILSGNLASAEDVKRFYHEAEAAASLDHPNIVPIYEVGRQEGQHFLSMAYIDGPSLSDLLAGGPLPPREGAAIVRLVADGIAFAHSRGIIHRDLKPGNILLARFVSRSSGSSSHAVNIAGTVHRPQREGIYEPKITDFGLAKRVDSAKQLTATGQILGTPGFMPPEQSSGDPTRVGTAADVYALGAILYCLLTGRPPFQAATSLETVLQATNHEPVSPRQLNPQTPKDLETICLKCLEKEPAKRYGSAQKLADDLARFLQGEPIHARPVGYVERTVKRIRRNPVVSSLIAAVFLTMAVGTGVAAWFGFESQRYASVATKKAGEAKAEARRADAKAQFAKEKEELAKVKAALARKNEEDAKTNLKLAQENQRIAEKNEQLANFQKKRAEDALAAAEKARAAAVHLAYDIQIVLSRREWETGNVAKALDVLEQTPWGLRGWEYRFLRHQYNREPEYPGHNASIVSLAFSPDGRYLASGDGDGFVKLWELWSRHELFTFRADGLYAFALAFSSDSTWLATAGVSGEIIIWETSSGKKVRTIRDQRGSVIKDLAFSHDKALIASGGRNGSAKIWQAATGKLIHTLPGHSAPIEEVVFQSRSFLLATCDERGGLKLWNAMTGKEENLKVSKATPATPIWFGQDGDLHCWVVKKKICFRCNARTGKMTNRPNVNKSEFETIATTFDGRRVAMLKRNAVVQIQEIQNRGGLLRSIPTRGKINVMAFDAKGELLAVAGDDHRIRTWQVHLKASTRNVAGPTRSFIYHPRSDKSVGMSDNFSLIVRSISSGAIVGHLAGHTARITCRGFSPDGSRFLTGSADKTVKVWDLSDSRCIATLAGHDSEVKEVLPTGDPRYIGSIDTTGKLFVWNVETGKRTASFDAVRGAGDPSGPNIVYVPSDEQGPKSKKIIFFKCRTNTPATLVDGISNVQHLGVVPGGRYVVARPAKRTDQIRLIPIDGGKVKDIDFSRPITQFSLSPDGKFIAGELNPDRIFLHNIATGETVENLDPKKDSLYSVSFSAAGNRLVSATYSGLVKIWELQGFQPILTLKHPENRNGRGRPTFVGFVNDGAQIIWCAQQETTIWDAGEPFRVHRTDQLDDIPTAIALRPDRKQFAVATERGGIYVWDAEMGKQAYQLKNCTGWGNPIAFSPDNKFLATVVGKKISVHNTEDGTIVKSFELGRQPAQSVAFHPYDSYVVGGGRSGKIIAWDLKTGKELYQLKSNDGTVRKIVFSGDGKRLAGSFSVGGYLLGTYHDKSAAVWDVSTPNPVMLFGSKAGNGPIHDLHLNSSGDKLAMARNQSVSIFDIEKKKIWKKIEAHGGVVLSVQFSPSDEKLLTSGEDDAVRVWDLENGKEVFLFKGHREDVLGAVFGPNGQWVLTRGLDELCYLFNLAGRRQSFPLGGAVRRIRSVKQ